MTASAAIATMARRYVAARKLILPARTQKPSRFRSRPPIAPDCPPLVVAVSLALMAFYGMALAALLFR